MVNVNVDHVSRLRVLAGFVDARPGLPSVMYLGTYFAEAELQVMVADDAAAVLVAWMDALPVVDRVVVWRLERDGVPHAEVFGSIGARSVKVWTTVEPTVLPSGVLRLVMTAQQFRDAAAGARGRRGVWGEPV